MSESSPPKPKKRRRRRRINRGGSGRHYFTQAHEDAIVEYCKPTTTIQEKEVLYRDFIQPAFDEMVDKIVFTYKFTNLPNCDDLRAECKVWLTTVLDKFDQSKGSKAFSYFSVITKNWFIHKVKKHTIKRQREIYFEDMHPSVEEEFLTTYNKYVPQREEYEFWMALNAEMDLWAEMPMKPNEERVYKAIRILLENPDDIEIFNKKAIYLYIREMTGLNTKQVVNNLNKLRARYHSFKSDWNKGNIRHIKDNSSDEESG